jgi:diguanylate cyclase (GGDEF)-like protein/PAS domain S-box-containing protein
MITSIAQDYLTGGAERREVAVSSQADARPRILLVDDEPRLLSSLHALLQDSDYQLSTATTGAEVLAHLSQTAFDLVLLDLRLPDMHGHDIMDHILAHEIDISVIVLSGEPGINAVIGALKRGAYGYLRKPYAHEELFKTIDNALQKRKLQSENQKISWQLQCSEKLYRSLVNSSPDVIYILDSNGNFTFVNERIQQSLGYRPDELIGQHYSAIVDESDRARANMLFKTHRAAEHGAQNVELTFRCAKGVEPAVRIFENTLLSVAFHNDQPHELGGAARTEQFWGTYGVARDITERKRIDQLVSFQAYHDILTGLPNRALFKDRLELALAQANRNKTELALGFFDLDRFKLINDTHGHIKGDELLQEVASRLKQRLRQTDTLARMGGDEFTVIIPELRNRHDATKLIDKFMECLREPFLLAGHEVRVSASIGVAVYPSDGTNMNDLLRHADIAMYQAKAAGRNTMRFFDPEMQAKVIARAELEQEIRASLSQNHFVLHYQPQAGKNGDITGVEALVRWQHPTRGMVPPMDFIPLAEETGLIIPLGQWILHTACVRLAIWMKQPATAALTMAVNVSARQFRHPDFVEQVLGVLAETGANPKRLKIELTESLLLDDVENTITKMTALKAKGIGFSLDDFGVGYSSLSYLKRLPLDQLKIDQSFVRDVLTDANDATIAHTIVTLGRTLGLAVIAEGVETEAQQDFLSNHGCDAYQGYLFSRPLSAEQLEAFILAKA